MPHSPEELLAHAGWLRALARSLVRDEAAADDLVQETWSRALARPARAAGPLGPWLARVLRNRAREERRGAGRRAERGAGSAGPEALPSAAALVERMELQRALVDLVLKLDEPYRATLVLRYYEGLGAADIARLRGVPASTVRAQLARGLERLRARLDERAGSREAWAAVLAPGITTASAAGAPTLIPGVLAMNTAWKLGAAAAAVAGVAAIGLRIAGGRGEPVAPVQGPQAQVAAALADPGTGEPLAAVEEAHVREPVHASPEISAPPAEAPVAAAPAGIVVRARAVDPALAPRAGATLAHVGWELVGVERRELAVVGELSAPSGADGRLALALAHGGGQSFTVTAPARATLRLLETLPDAGEVDLGDLVLVPGGAVAGRVLDPAGLPCSGAEVAVDRPGDRLVEPAWTAKRSGPEQYGHLPGTRTDEQGRFLVDGVEVGHVRVWAGAPGAFWNLREGVLVEAGATADVGDLALEAAPPEEYVAGVVLDPKGLPLAGVSVRCTWSGDLGQRTFFDTSDADGRFAFLAVERAPHDLSARDDHGGRWPEAAAEGVLPGTPGLALRFREARSLVVEARLAGQQVAEFDLALLHRERMRGVDWAKGREGAARFFEPAQTFWLRVRAEGAVEAVLGPYEPGELGPTTTVELAPQSGVHGRVTAGGEPVAGARVQLYALARQREAIHVNGFPSRHTAWSEVETTTDAEGAFDLSPQEARDYLLRVEAAGYAPAEVELLAFDPVAGAGPLAVALERGGAIAGVVRVRPGAEAAGTLVAASRGDAFPKVARADADGAFRFEGLAPGGWLVEALGEDPRLSEPSSFHSIATGGRPPFESNCTVHSGATTRFDLDLAALPLCVVRGVLAVDGAPAAGWEVGLESLARKSGRASENPTGFSGADGAFRLEVSRPGAYRLQLQRAGDPSGFALAREVTLADGELDASYALATGRLAGEGAAPGAAGFDKVYLLWRGPEGALVVMAVEPDAEGRFALASVPAGDVELVRFGPGMGSDGERETEVLATARVPAGGEAFARLE